MRNLSDHKPYYRHAIRLLNKKLYTLGRLDASINWRLKTKLGRSGFIFHGQ